MKTFKKFFNKILTENERLKTYSYPIVKILICLVLITVFYNCDLIFTDNELINIPIGSLSTASIIVCGRCIFVAVSELFIVHKNRIKTIDETVKPGKRGVSIFEWNDSLETYTHTILKILICLFLIAVTAYFEKLFHTGNRVVNSLLFAVSFTIIFGCVQIIYSAICELSEVHENRIKKKTISLKSMKRSRAYSIDEISEMVIANDIIEIQIVKNSRIVEIGSSSDCETGNSKFFDKRFYVNKKEFENVEEFKNAIQSYSDNEKIIVLSIDGLPPDKI